MAKNENQSSNSLKVHNCNPFFQGSKLGILAAGLGSFLFLVVDIGVLWISAKLSGTGIVSENMLVDSHGYLVFFFIIYWSAGLLLVFLTSVIPGILGGLCNAWILKYLAQSSMLTLVQGIVTGILMGIVFSAVPIYVGVLFVNKFFDTPPFIEVVISGLLVATLIGAWHGWKMTQYITQECI